MPPSSLVGFPASSPFMILLTHPTGNANVRHAALGLHRAGLLGEFWTGINYAVPSWLGSLLPKRFNQRLQRRSYPLELNRKIHTYPWREASRQLASRVGLGAFTDSDTGPCSEDAVYRSLDRQVAKRLSQATFTGVYAYENGAEYAFRAAKDAGQLCIYDQPIGHWKAAQEILEEEAEKEPEWASLLGNVHNGAAKNRRRDTELELADVVVVASAFTKRTLEEEGRIRARIAVVPYGCPTPPQGLAESNRTSTDKLRVLYVGPLSQRRGLSYLFSAVQQLGGAAELTIIGRKPPRSIPALERELSKVRFLPYGNHTEVLREMTQHDVLVFPSLFESFGSELLDAMAMGLPVIATPNSAAPDLISDGNEGFLVPIRSSNAIAERLHLLYREPDRRVEMGLRAAARAKEFSWRRYETTLATRVSETLAFAGHGTSPSFARATPDPELPGVFPRQEDESA